MLTDREKFVRYLIPLLAFASLPALAQQMQPGEWQFTSTTTSPAFPGPQTATFKNCVKKEDTSDMQGRKLEMRTRMSGKRLGPCKS